MPEEDANLESSLDEGLNASGNNDYASSATALVNLLTSLQDDERPVTIGQYALLLATTVRVVHTLTIVSGRVFKDPAEEKIALDEAANISDAFEKALMTLQPYFMDKASDGA